MTGSAGLEFRTRAKIFNISIIRTPSPAYILKHRKNCERCPTQFPGKSSLKGNHIFPVCPVCPFCPVYPLCPVSPDCPEPDRTSCLSCRSSLCSVTCLWYFSPEIVAKWPKGQLEKSQWLLCLLWSWRLYTSKFEVVLSPITPPPK